LKTYLKTVAWYLPLPFLVGAYMGWIFPGAGEETKSSISEGITGFGNIFAFELFSILSIMVVSAYVFLKGSVSSELGKLEKVLIYWLPATALGFVVPFFAAMYGFIFSHPESEDLKALSILGVIGFIWSAGFLILMLAPAHEGVWPKAPEQKKKLYVILLLSTVIVAIWQYLT
jgi:putative Mn2+ efflux pump MntP